MHFVPTPEDSPLPPPAAQKNVHADESDVMSELVGAVQV
jgi:hypothetical protein